MANVFLHELHKLHDPSIGEPTELEGSSGRGTHVLQIRGGDVVLVRTNLKSLRALHTRLGEYIAEHTDNSIATQIGLEQMLMEDLARQENAKL